MRTYADELARGEWGCPVKQERTWVYVVTRGEYSDYEIVAVFRTFDAAKAYVEQQETLSDPGIEWRSCERQEGVTYWYRSAEPLRFWDADYHVEVFELEEG